MFKSKKNIFIVSVLAIIILVIGVGFIVEKTAKPGKYDSFAQALKSEGAVFYGAFWCPHCQATKALFGSSKKYVPYVECSTPDSRGQTSECKANKIESYPSWTFKNGITVNSSDPKPLVCMPSPNGAKIEGEPAVCSNIHSEYGKVWVFSNYKFSIKSEKDPVQNGNTWTFDSGAMAVGEIPLEFLAEQIKFTLPQ
ncbi:MAG: hypothetical protein RL687_300 [Candidatus Parcubacteria bacterium]|jgi:thiol-disulfide isomerase/thioredoxin